VEERLAFGLLQGLKRKPYMYSDVVKIDSKGRITIPSAIRLLLNMEEGDKMVLLFDEDELKIELLSTKATNVIVCKLLDDFKNVVEMLKKLSNGVIAFSCRCYDTSCNKFRCKFILEEKALKSSNNMSLQCLSTNL
jgi:AbrB family looped-hinge helix DNA binding protein